MRVLATHTEDSYERCTIPGANEPLSVPVAVRNAVKNEKERPESRSTHRFLIFWWSRTGSNRRPPECHSGALPIELRPHVGWQRDERVRIPRAL